MRDARESFGRRVHAAMREALSRPQEGILAEMRAHQEAHERAIAELRAHQEAHERAIAELRAWLDGGEGTDGEPERSPGFPCGGGTF
jgi:hypothetical protein